MVGTCFVERSASGARHSAAHSTPRTAHRTHHNKHNKHNITAIQRNITTRHGAARHDDSVSLHTFRSVLAHTHLLFVGQLIRVLRRHASLSAIALVTVAPVARSSNRHRGPEVCGLVLGYDLGAWRCKRLARLIGNLLRRDHGAAAAASDRPSPDEMDRPLPPALTSEGWQA